MQISTLERHSLMFYLATKKKTYRQKKIQLHQILIGLRDHCKQ
jgi:hypothetical protein